MMPEKVYAVEYRALKDENVRLKEQNFRLFQIAESLREALVWCGGADDFAPDGKGREGWIKGAHPILVESGELLKEIKESEKGIKP